jgi:lysophospholipase L1-like esterase
MMSSRTTLVRFATLGAVLAVVACETSRDVLGPVTPAGGEIFQRYVAIGNSITAGFQSNGINDSTQRQAYPLLLARAMGTRYAYPALAMPGCPAPIADTQTGALVGQVGTTLPPPCAARVAGSVTEILNNVAVPGARVLDPTSPTDASNALTTFVLGGKTQVQRALDAEPTFVTIWIGNNDVLQAGLSGILVPGVVPGLAGIRSTQAQFQAAYDALTSQLVAGAPEVKGVLLGVAQVSNLPSMSLGGLIAASPTIQGGLTAAAGKPVTVLPNCTGSASLVNVPQLIQAIRSNTHPAVLSCEPGAVTPPVGDVFVLDLAEQVTLGGAIAAYNAYISSRADALGFGFWDPNPLFVAKRATGEIPPFPNLASPTATFGPLISLDGVHPTGEAHRLIANELIDVINAKYGTTLTAVP